MKIVCNCTSEFQDSRYGKNIRIGNEMQPKDKMPQEFRCTVCRSVTTKNLGPVVVPKVEKA